MRLVLALALAAALAACSRPEPSPEYQEAAARWRELLAQHPADPWQRPEADRVLELLGRVAPRSLDAEAAAALRQRIEGERAAALQEAQRRAGLVDAAGRPTRPAPDRPAAAGELPAGPPGTAGLPPVGTALADFQRERGDCFEARAPARLRQPGGAVLEAEAWALKDLPACRAAHPAAVGQALLFAGGKLATALPAALGKEEVTTEQVGGAVQPDGSVAVVGPGGEVRTLPPGAKVKWSELPPEGAAAGSAAVAPGPAR